MGTDFDNRPGAMGVPTPDESDDDGKGSGEAPDTPLDEPRPPRVQDPPPQPGQKGPYVVHSQSR